MYPSSPSANASNPTTAAPNYVRFATRSRERDFSALFGLAF